MVSAFLRRLSSSWSFSVSSLNEMRHLDPIPYTEFLDALK